MAALCQQINQWFSTTQAWIAANMGVAAGVRFADNSDKTDGIPPGGGLLGLQRANHHTYGNNLRGYLTNLQAMASTKNFGPLGDRFDMPKLSVDSKLKGRRHKTAEVMTEDLGENLVDLRDGRLRPNARAELRLDHVECRLHIRPLMVVRQELLAMISEKLKHASPQLTASRRDAAIARLAPVPASGVVVRLERNKRKRASASDSVKVGVADISSISSDRLDVESLGSPVEERG